MLISLLIFLLISNAVTLRRDKSILFSRIVIMSLLNRAYSRLEWCLNSPPKPHAFASLPLQSALPSLFSLSALKIPLHLVIFFIVVFLVKLPVAHTLKALNMILLLFIVLGLISAAVYAVKSHFVYRVFPTFKQLFAVFILSILISLGIYVTRSCQFIDLNACFSVWLAFFYLPEYLIPSPCSSAGISGGRKDTSILFADNGGGSNKPSSSGANNVGGSNQPSGSGANNGWGSGANNWGGSGADRSVNSFLSEINGLTKKINGVLYDLPYAVIRFESNFNLARYHMSNGDPRSEYYASAVRSERLRFAQLHSDLNHRHHLAVQLKGFYPQCPVPSSYTYEGIDSKYAEPLNISHTLAHKPQWNI